LQRLKLKKEEEKNAKKKEEENKKEVGIDPSKSEVVGIFWNVMVIGVESKFIFYPKNNSGKLMTSNDFKFDIYCMSDEDAEYVPKLACVSPKVLSDGGYEFTFTPSNEFNQTWYSFDISQKENILAQNTNVLIGTEKKIETEMKKYAKKIQQLGIKEKDSASTGLETKLGGQIQKLQTKLDSYEEVMKFLQSSKVQEIVDPMSSPTVKVLPKKLPPTPTKKPEVKIDAKKSYVHGHCWTVMMIGLKCSLFFFPMDSNGQIVKCDDLKFEIYCMSDEDAEDIPKLACISPSSILSNGGVEFSFTPNESFNQTWYSFDIVKGNEILAQNTNVLIGSKKKIETEMKKYLKKIQQLEIKEKDSASTGLETKLGGQIQKLQTKLVEYEKLMKTLQ
jgi:hypothetical protein